MSTTIMCGLFIVAFTFKNEQITWLWTDNSHVACILGTITALLGTQWIKHQRLLNNTRRN
jgi:hypothetical protein